MCSIVASFDWKKLKELVALNAYRGATAHSLTVLGPNGELFRCERKEGPIDFKEYTALPSRDDVYFIVHQQAPTDTDPSVGVHPAEVYNDLLWHNGILKPATISRMQLGQDIGWDTKLLAYWLAHGKKLDSTVDGSFACLRYVGNEKALYAFRNEIAPLFFDKDLTISSTKAEGLLSLPPNIMWKLDLKNKGMSGVDTFITAANPYYFGEPVGNEPQGPDRG